MIWLLTVLVSSVTVSAQLCNVALLAGKVLQPKPSVDNGATFLSRLHTETKEVCQQGCCDSGRCDTILFTGSKSVKGNNCFYFDCHDHCAFRDATQEERSYNYSVATVSQSPTHQDLPDFSDLFVSSQPKPADQSLDTEQKDNSTETHQAVETPVAPPKDVIPTNDTQTAEEKVQPAPSEAHQSVDTVAKNPDTTVKDAPVKAATVKPEVAAKNKSADAVPEKNEADEADPTKPSSAIADGPVTVKNNDEKPETSKVTPAHEAAKPDKVKPADSAKPATEKEDATPTEKPKPKLPNEVPVVTGKGGAKVNGTEGKTAAGHKEQGKTASKEEKKPGVVVVDKPEKKEGSDETKPANNVSVEVDIHTVQSKQPDTYTQKDVVFWVAVVGGSALIVTGLALVIRYYGNKRRRLYSSLTDDYLINGMYSI